MVEKIPSSYPLVGIIIGRRRSLTWRRDQSRSETSGKKTRDQFDEGSLLRRLVASSTGLLQKQPTRYSVGGLLPESNLGEAQRQGGSQWPTVPNLERPLERKGSRSQEKGGSDSPAQQLKKERVAWIKRKKS